MVFEVFGPYMGHLFAYLISKSLCNIYRSLDAHGEKSAALEVPHRLNRERPIG